MGNAIKCHQPRLGKPASNFSISSSMFQSEFRDVAKPPCAWYRAKGAEFGSVSSQTCSEIGLQLWRHKLMQHGLGTLGTSASKGAFTGQEHQQQQLRSLSCLVMARAVLVASIADVSPILGGGAVPKTHVIPFCCYFMLFLELPVGLTEI